MVVVCPSNSLLEPRLCHLVMYRHESHDDSQPAADRPHDEVPTDHIVAFCGGGPARSSTVSVDSDIYDVEPIDGIRRTMRVKLSYMASTSIHCASTIATRFTSNYLLNSLTACFFEDSKRNLSTHNLRSLSIDVFFCFCDHSPCVMRVQLLHMGERV